MENVAKYHTSEDDQVGSDSLEFGCPYCEGVLETITFAGEGCRVRYTVRNAPESVMDELDGTRLNCSVCGRELTLHTKEIWKVNKMLEVY